MKNPSDSQKSEAIQKIKVQKGEFIFFEGDIDFDFYIVEKGQVEIFVKSKQGKKVPLQLIEEGESFGEFALLDRQARSASAQAVTDCHIIRVSEAGYLQLLGELPIWASSMLMSFSKRLRNMNERLKEMPQFIDYKNGSSPK